MRYYFLIFFLTMALFAGFIYKQKESGIESIKASKIAANPQISIGELFLKNFGNHRWQSVKNNLGQPGLLFSGIVLPQDSLRLNGAQINFLFAVNSDSGLFKTDSVWWSYPASYLEKKRTELGCFEPVKLNRSLKYLYAQPANLLVFNGKQWFSCFNPVVSGMLSTADLREITEKLLNACPLSVQTHAIWQVNAMAAGWETIGWTAGEKTFAFAPGVQQEIKNLLRHNYNQNSRLAYLNGGHGLDHTDSLKIFY